MHEAINIHICSVFPLIRKLVDKWMRCDLIQTAYPGSDCGGSSSSRGPQTSLSLVRRGKSVTIWLIGGISECK